MHENPFFSGTLTKSPGSFLNLPRLSPWAAERVSANRLSGPVGLQNVQGGLSRWPGRKVIALVACRMHRNDSE